MTQVVNEVYEPVFIQIGKVRYIILMGGRGAGRSYIASQVAVAKIRSPEYFRCAIMRLVLSDIRNSIYQEIRDRIEEQELDVTGEVDVKDSLLFKCGENKIQGIGFRKSSGDQKSKLKSLANYNCVIIEEADEIGEADFIQLDDSLRTTKSPVTVFLLLNPPDKNHWIVKRFFNLVEVEGAEGFYKPELKPEYKDEVLFIHTSYEDNEENIDKTTLRNFENYRKKNPDHYFNMIKGYVSSGVRGRVYKNIGLISYKEFNELGYPSIYGLDFGFSNDPLSLNEIKKHNKKMYAHQLIYEKGMTDDDLDARMIQLGIPKDALIYADSAEPKSIEALQRKGWNIVPARKGPDSVRSGINHMLTYEQYFTEDSSEMIEEGQTYVWALDKNKEPTNTPVDKNNHAMDANRYAVTTDDYAPFIGVA